MLLFRKGTFFIFPTLLMAILNFLLHTTQTKRETYLMSILYFVSSSNWKALFGKSTNFLERSINHADKFMIVDYKQAGVWVLPLNEGSWDPNDIDLFIETLAPVMLLCSLKSF